MCSCSNSLVIYYVSFKNYIQLFSRIISAALVKNFLIFNLILLRNVRYCVPNSQVYTPHKHGRLISLSAYASLDQSPELLHFILFASLMHILFQALPCFLLFSFPIFSKIVVVVPRSEFPSKAPTYWILYVYSNIELDLLQCEHTVVMVLRTWKWRDLCYLEKFD